MGLDKKKSILTRDEFAVEPFKANNLVLSVQDRSSLPTMPDDVMIDRHQSVYYSVEYALQRLMQNDKFIDEFLATSKSYVSFAIDNGLLTSQNTSIDQTPDSTRIYNQYLDRHLFEYHNGAGAYADIVDKADCMLSTVEQCYLDVDASNFDEPGARSHFLQRHGQCLSNDILVEIEYNDSPNVRKATNYVNVTVANKQTRWAFKQMMVEQSQVLDATPKLDTCTYIYKRWLSGLKELYIHLPTSFTFYNQHGADWIDGNHINENATWIKVLINKRHFSFKHIYQAYINGQSLPMQIHNDDSALSGFNDIILPSMLRTMCTSTEQPTATGETQNTSMIYDSYQSQYVLYFVCYGTDEQAIHIIGD